MKKLSNPFGLKGRFKILKFKKSDLPAEQRKEQILKGLVQPCWESPVMNNLIMLSAQHGLNIVIRRLAGDTAIDLPISSGSIGTGSTAPTESDTDLETPVVQNIRVAIINNDVDSVTPEFFISDEDLADGTYREFGVFVNEDDEKLFARALFSSPYAKSAGEDTLIQYTITASTS